jgi:hypothetical protein
MSQISENMKILINPLDYPSRRQVALDKLAALGSLEAIVLYAKGLWTRLNTRRFVIRQ